MIGLLARQLRRVLTIRLSQSWGVWRGCFSSTKYNFRNRATNTSLGIEPQIHLGGWRSLLGFFISAQFPYLLVNNVYVVSTVRLDGKTKRGNVCIGKNFTLVRKLWNRHDNQRHMMTKSPYWCVFMLCVSLMSYSHLRVGRSQPLLRETTLYTALPKPLSFPPRPAALCWPKCFRFWGVRLSQTPSVFPSSSMSIFLTF